MIRNARIIYFFAILYLGIGLSSCHGDPQHGKASEGSPGLLVDVFVALPTTLSSQIVTTANLLPYEEVEIKAPVSGTVMDIYFKEGHEVKAGQTLVQLDDRIWRAQIKGLKARLASAENELKRNKALIQLEGVSKEVAEQSQATVEELQARIEELSVYVKLASVSAPFSGILGMRNFSIGTYMTQGQAITHIAQIDKIKVEFDLASVYLDRIYKGQTIQVVSSSDTVGAVIYAVDPVVSTVSRTLKVRALIENNTKSLVPGDFADVIITPSGDVKTLAVPTDAIAPELGAHTLFVVMAGRAEKRVVELGTRTSAMVEIVHGLTEGDSVLITGLMQVRPNMPVRIRHITSPEIL